MSRTHQQNRPGVCRGAHRPTYRAAIIAEACAGKASRQRTWILMGADQRRAPTAVTILRCEAPDVYASIDALRGCGGRGEAFEVLGDGNLPTGLLDRLRGSRAARQALRAGALPGVRTEKVR